MSSRPSWDGFLKFNLIAVPVKAFNAVASGGGKIGFHLLHAKCNSRIRYKKVCPIHGEVENDEIVSGYEVSKGQYVIVGADERGELRSENDKAINVDTFVATETIDPVYFSGRSYYLVPDGKVAQKPYIVLLESMREKNRCALAQVVFAGRAQVALVHPLEGLLAMSLLHYESDVKKPSTFEAEIEHSVVSAEERKLAETLIEAATAKEFDLGHYKDDYARKLAKLVEGKTRRTKRAAPQGREEPTVINLMDALRQSLDRAQKGQGGKKAKKSPATKVRKSSVPARRKTG